MGIYIYFIFTAGLVLGIVIFLRVMTKRKSKYGLNFKRVYCPVCDTEQPMIRFPKNANQALYGGYTCSKCLAELDKYGNIVY